METVITPACTLEAILQDALQSSTRVSYDRGDRINPPCLDVHVPDTVKVVWKDAGFVWTEIEIEYEVDGVKCLCLVTLETKPEKFIDVLGQTCWRLTYDVECKEFWR